MRNAIVRFTLLVTSIALLLTGCGPQRLGLGRQPVATATPTWAPVPTFTPSPAPPPTLLPTATALSVPTATTTPAAIAAPVTEVTATQATTLAAISLLPTSTQPPSAQPEVPEVAAVDTDTSQVTVIVEAANIRYGPSTDYLTIGAATRGQHYPLTGRVAQGDWWQICCFDEQPGWIFAALVEVRNAEAIAVITDLPPLPVLPTVAPIEAPVVAAEVEAEPAVDAAAEEVSPAPDAHRGTAGNFDPNAQYQIVHYRVLGFDDNNGGIFNKGGQQFIFVTVLDQNGNGVDGAVVKDAVGDKLNVVVGSKGPGKAEIKMDWDPYKLYVAADPSGAVTSQISNQMNNPYPHIPDVVGMLGPPENEYAICPTLDDRCSPPFYHAHWSYEITFQRVK